MRARLPSRTKYPENGRILSCQESSRQRATRCDSQSLNESIRKDCQRFAGFRGKQQNEADPLITGRCRYFVLDDPPAPFFPADDIGVKTQSHNLFLTKGTLHGFKTIDAAIGCSW